jgi:hypothetical protein
MYNVAIVFALLTINSEGHELEQHGKFAHPEACEFAASIVERSLREQRGSSRSNVHPLPRGHAVVCRRQAEVRVTASYNPENT